MRLNVSRYAPWVAGVLLAWGALAPGLLKAQSLEGPWRIHSPAPDTLIRDGSLFVVVSVRGGERLDPESVALAVDGVDLTRQAKISETSVRLLYNRSIGGGRHEVRITAQNRRGDPMPELRWTFDVEGPPVEPAARLSAGRRFAFSGNTIIDTRTSDFSGRRDLRQEPLRTYVFQADAEGQYGAFTFPVRVYLTTDENGRTQPRNRFLFGLRSEHLTLLFGDTTPLYNPLMLDGARTRGLRGEVKFNPIRLSAVRGQLRRGITPLFQPDSTFLPGTFERTLTAFRLGLGSERSVLWNLNVVHARDDPASISLTDALELGITPMENLVVGSDLALRLFRGRFRLEGGAALSITTEDLSRGAATKAEIDSLFDVNLPLDPASYDWLITINASTVPLRVDKLSSLAWYVRSRVSTYGHTLTAEFQEVGEAYSSFGNPFLLNDRRTFTVTDRFKVLGDRVSGTLRYRHYGTPPRNNPLSATLTADLFSGQLALSPWRGPTWLYVGVRVHNRGTTADGTGEQRTDTRVVSYSAGGYHLARTGGFQHGLNLSYTYTDRSDRVLPALDNTTQALTVGLNEQFPFPLYVNLQVNRLRVRSGEDETLQDLTTLSGRLGYRLPKPELNVSFGFQNTHTAETELLLSAAESAVLIPSSDRSSVFLRGVYRVRGNMEVELQFGYDTYRGDAEYTDRYVILRHRYTF